MMYVVDMPNAKPGVPTKESVTKKLGLAGQLYHFAYTLKKHQLKLKHPEFSESDLRRKTVELIEKGCK